jgi:hypothetical protein
MESRIERERLEGETEGERKERPEGTTGRKEV